ncbi:hypothetical protein IQ255_00630 [Pleurocapsales cyanobacterium LEGE 10410]|nr:hypothetical protein [Pleurocapsales cyanobacterium LEGE 10410]
MKSEYQGQLAVIRAETLLKHKEAEIAEKDREIARLNCQLQQGDREINALNSELNKGLHELKLKYKNLIAQFIQERANKLEMDSKNKSIQTCQNLFKKAQKRIYLLQCENKFVKQENLNLRNKVKMLRV